MSLLNRETLLAGLKAAKLIKGGKLQTADELEAAPLLSCWALEEVYPSLYRLIGMVQGHPIVPDGFCTTSVILVIDLQQTWARTVSRIYRLNAPLFGG